MKVVKLGEREFLSTDDTLQVLGEKGGLVFGCYYTPSTYYQSVVLNKDGTVAQWSGRTKPDIQLYNIENLLKEIK